MVTGSSIEWNVRRNARHGAGGARCSIYVTLSGIDTRVVRRVTSVPISIHITQVVTPVNLDRKREACVVGSNKHNGKPVSRLTGSVRCAKGDGNKDPGARACDENNGSHPRVSGPVPNCRCNLSWVSIPESVLAGWQADGLVQCPSCKRLNPERVYNYLNPVSLGERVSGVAQVHRNSPSYSVSEDPVWGPYCPIPQVHGPQYVHTIYPAEDPV